MTADIREIFNEIRRIQYSETDENDRYRALDRLLTRCIKSLTQDYPVDFTHVATRLHWLCKSNRHPSYPLEVFRARAYRIRLGHEHAETDNYPYDLKAVCEGLAAFYHTDIPDDLHKILPHHWRSISSDAASPHALRIRLTVHHWDRRFIYGQDNAHPTKQELRVSYISESDPTFADLYTQLYEGAQLNLLSVRILETPEPEHREYPCTLYPDILILDPDFLVDITSICACMKPYGHSPYTYLLNKFFPSVRSATLQLGNVANQFLDDCVNENGDGMTEDSLYLRSMQKSFRLSPLTYSTLPGIDSCFFDQCREQFRNIRRTVSHSFSAAAIDIRQTEVLLEPSFLCEALGIQGRMDLLTTDADKLVELNSGKAEEYPYRHPRDEHRLQMALYKEILYYNLGRLHGQVQSFLFYSRYPQFYAIDVPQAEIRRVMALRNAILHLEHRLRNGASREVMEELDEAHLNVNNRKDRLYMQYLRPRLLEVLIPLRQMNNLESTYFHCFLTFMEREQFLAKVGDSRPDSSRGFAETWTGDTLSKQQNGNILIDLKLHPVTDDEGTITELRMELPDYGDDFLPNFRPGDMVMLYERHSERDLATNKQFFRCTVEEMQPDYLLLKLAYKQRNVGAFHPDSLYAVEPGYMDSTFNQTYSGLFGLLVAPKERKELLLGQRKPGVNPTAVLNRHYLNEEIDRIVLKAKQAEDYFLLVGPPGTGKTSVALKSMVEEFLSDSPEKTLLLMAYTNRAVDEICAMLSSLSPAPDYIRIGQELSCAPEFRSRLMQNAIGDATSRRQIYERLSPVRLFAGTVSSLCNQTELFSLKPVDIAIIDEASQVLEPQLLPLLCATTEAHSGDYNLRRCAIGKFILIGDHKQLPAVVVQRPETSHVTDPLLNSIGLTDCRNSLFERLHALSIRQETENIVEMLHRQGRMHPAISTFVNEKYYHGNLDLVPLRHQEEELKFNVHPEDRWSTFIARTRMGFISVMPEETEGNEKSNRNEAETVARLVETLYELFRLNKMDTDLPRHVGIIVPFRAQIAMIRKSLDRRHIPGSDAITVDTVERYQGSQRDVIIFSTTVSRFYQLDILSEPILIEGQLLDRKLNVALTRARKQFFLIGQEQLLRHCQAYREWLDYLDENQILRPLSDKEE